MGGKWRNSGWITVVTSDMPQCPIESVSWSSQKQSFETMFARRCRWSKKKSPLDTKTMLISFWGRSRTQRDVRTSGKKKKCRDKIRNNERWSNLCHYAREQSFSIWRWQCLSMMAMTLSHDAWQCLSISFFVVVVVVVIVVVDPFIQRVSRLRESTLRVPADGSFKTWVSRLLGNRLRWHSIRRRCCCCCCRLSAIQVDVGAFASLRYEDKRT